jgi:hypothetical protein
VLKSKALQRLLTQRGQESSGGKGKDSSSAYTLTSINFLRKVCL